MAGRRLIGALLISVLLCAESVRGAPVVDPAFRFRTIRTPHFVIYFHQGEDHLAGRLALIVEEVWRSLQQALAVTPPPLTHVVLTGRNAKEELIGIADLVTEMTLVKHPFRSGIKAQPGVEF